MAKFKANRKGFATLRKSAEVRADLERRVDAISAATGAPDLFVTDSEIGRNRARASVRTYGREASLLEATEHTMSASIDAGAGDSRDA